MKEAKIMQVIAPQLYLKEAKAGKKVGLYYITLFHSWVQPKKELPS